MGFCTTVMIVGSTQIFEESGREGEFINDLLAARGARLHPRHVVPKPTQAYEPEVPSHETLRLASRKITIAIFEACIRQGLG